MEPQIDAEEYFDHSYDTKGRFCSYWHQIDEAMRLSHKSVLEIGPGNGLVAEYLRRRQVSVLTIDIDHRLNPDVVGTLTNMPFAEDSFDLIMCCEVLEHLPYEQLSGALSEIHRTCRSDAVLSVPDIRHDLRFDVRLRTVGEFGRTIAFPRLRRPVHVFDGQHYWEIGKASYPMVRVVKDIESSGFVVANTYCVPENPWHRFFILKKRR